MLSKKQKLFPGFNKKKGKESIFSEFYIPAFDNDENLVFILFLFFYYFIIIIFLLIIVLRLFLFDIFII
jgi:hypothetical protein